MISQDPPRSLSRYLLNVDILDLLRLFPIVDCTHFLAGDWVARDHKGGMHVPNR